MNQLFVKQFNEQSSIHDLHSYSKFKFGSVKQAANMAYELADMIWNHHQALLIANKCVFISSPYNYVQNAASLLTEYVVKFLNSKLYNVSENIIETTLIHRKVSYTADYGNMNKKMREELIEKDDFFINKDFIKNKILFFVDDIFVTGAHERRLQSFLETEQLTNKSFFVYYGLYNGSNELFEGKLNKVIFENMSHMDFYTKAAMNNYNVIVRSIKELLSMEDSKLLQLILSNIMTFNKPYVYNIYYGALGEKYHFIPKYHKNFAVLANIIRHDSLCPND